MPTIETGYQAEQALLRARLDGDAQERGCVVVGPAGSGKTTILEALRNRYAGPVLTVSGVRRTPDLVFGHLPACRETTAPEGDRPAAWLRWAVADACRERSGTALFVDDAHLLDDDAAAIVHSLVVHDNVPAFLACVLDADRSPAPAVRSLWKDRHLPRVDLPAIGAREVRDYLTRVIGHPVTTRDVAAFTRWSRGAPATLVDLTASSLEADQWEVVGGVAVLMQRPSPSVEERERLAEAVEGLSEGALAVVECFGAATPVIGTRMLDWLPLGPMIDLAGWDALLEAERCGVIEADTTRVRLTVPFLADAAARRTPALRRAELAGRLATAIKVGSGTRTGASLEDEALALTGLLALTTPQGASAGVRLAAARSAHRLGDPEAVRALAAPRADIHSADDPELAVLYAWALIHLNHLESLRVLTVRWADEPLPAWRGLVDFLTEFGRRRKLGGRAFLDLHDSDEGGLIGGVAERMSRDRMSGAWFCFLLAETAMLVGRYTEARGLLDAVGSAADDDGLLMFHLAYVDVRLQTAVSGADRACADTERIRQASGWRSDQVCAAADFVCGVAHANAGRFDDALAELRDSAPFLVATRLEDSSARLMGRITLMSTGTGWRAGAAPIEVPVDPYALLTVSELTLDRAWSLAADGDAAGSVDCLLDFAEAITGAAPTLAVDHFELAARFLVPGETEVTRRLTAGVGTVAETVEPARRIDALSGYAGAVRTADGAGLEAVAERYRSLGLAPVAADAFAQAADARRAAGATPAAVTDHLAAKRLAEAVGGLASPAQRLVAAPLLTRREAEIVALVAQTRSNAQIAEQLQLSVRTIEGHLLRASGKLGVRDRKALAEIWREQLSASCA